MSFGESVFLVGFNQKTAKGDLIVKEITEFRCVTNVERFQKTPGGSPLRKTTCL
jgi:hypothetical protein